MAGLDKPELRDDPRFLTAALREENKDARLEAMQAVSNKQQATV